ncbi:MAG: outer membrane protein assembly factor BamA [Rhodospirillales bacterium]|nr:outer membrane protein assembly factor BamA [Rhodospirillales bacterium]
MAAAQTPGAVVREITVDGTERIDPDTVRSYLVIQEGDPFDADRVDRSLKALFATGLFADVTLRRNGDTLVVAVVENPVINRIAFEGNRRLTTNALTAEVTLKPRVIYTRTKVQNDVKRILTLYRRSGRFAATVKPKIIQQPQNRIDLVFEINEGDVTAIERIRFVGNKEYSDGRLRDIIRTRETRWYRFFSSDDTYDPDRLTLDRDLLTRFYRRNGYADVRVVSAVAELTTNQEKFFLTFTVEEGPRYRLGTVGVESQLRGLNANQVDAVVELESNDWFDFEAVEKTINALTDAVSALGYAFVDVRPRVDRNRAAKTVNVAFEITEGPHVYVERIDIEGNSRTIDSVIRREFRLVEGDAFNASKLRRSRQRLQNLNYFERVTVEQVPGSAADRTVIKTNIQEKSTGSLSIGAGVSSAHGPLADVTIRERNLLGKGQDLNVNLQVSARRNAGRFSFTEPFFLDRDISAGFDIFHLSSNQQDTSSINIKQTGGGVRGGYPITERLSQRWGYNVDLTQISNVAERASPLIKSQDREVMSSEVTHSMTYDRRNSRINATEGYFVRFTNDVAGLGGDAQHFRNVVDGAQYFPFFDEYVIAVSGSAGHILGLGKDVYMIDRFFVGGDDLRGFANSGIGPRDSTNGDALGGEWRYAGSVELRFPIAIAPELGFNGRVFTDLGSLGGLEPTNASAQDTGGLRAAAGVGLTWQSPLGMIGLDFALPYLKEDFDDTQWVRFNFGTRF